jgi:hypothetical protein
MQDVLQISNFEFFIFILVQWKSQQNSNSISLPQLFVAKTLIKRKMNPKSPNLHFVHENDAFVALYQLVLPELVIALSWTILVSLVLNGLPQLHVGGDFLERVHAVGNLQHVENLFLQGPLQSVVLLQFPRVLLQMRLPSSFFETNCVDQVDYVLEVVQVKFLSARCC